MISRYYRRLSILLRLVQQIMRFSRRKFRSLLLALVSFLQQRIPSLDKRCNVVKGSSEETIVKWKACDDPCGGVAASRTPGVVVLPQDSHNDLEMALRSNDRPQASIPHPNDPPLTTLQSCQNVDSLAVEQRGNHGPMLHHARSEFRPIAPKDFQRYERSRKIPRTWNDNGKIPPLSMRMADPTPAGWIAYEHPEGALYFYHESKNTFTDANLRTWGVLDNISQLVDSFNSFVRLNKINLNPSIELVLDLEETGEDKGRCGYYLVDHDHRSIFWLDEFKKADLPDCNEVPGVTANAHIRHELAAQYWCHCELFPNTRTVKQETVDQLRDMLTHALGDVSTSPLSTIESTVDELQNMLHAVEAAEKQVGRLAPGSTCFLSRLMHIRARHRFINFHGQPSARLCRDQAIYDESSSRSYLITLLSPMLFSAPEVHLRMLHDIYVDRIVYATHVNKAISKLNSEWQELILYATVLLNANVALLAIQSVDDGGSDGIRTPVQISSYLSIAMSIGSIILGLLLVRQNRTEGKESAPEAMRFMSRHSLETLAILYSLPYALLMWAMLVFVGSFSFLCFDSTNLVTRLLVGPVCVVIAALIIWCIWYAWESSEHEPWWKPAPEKLVLRAKS
ncbi:hypothetical protein AB1N83_008525 [Pleurotus pulmonarius]|nr:hypothetical protein EYR38_002158 [Pleurotus pulmonarius]